MKFKLPLLMIGLFLQLFCVSSSQIREKFYWKLLDYKYESEGARNNALKTGEFVPKNNLPFGIEVWNNKIFITVPRRKSGIPSTLNYIDLNSTESSPALKPYPDWKSNHLSSNNIVSNYRINVDRCDRLWTFDTGNAVDVNRNVTRSFIPARVRVFDLKKNTIMFEHIVKNDIATECTSTGNFVTIIADVGTTCADTYAYAADPLTRELFVYSMAKNSSWVIKHPYFHPDPFHMNYKIGDYNMQLYDGIFGLALSEKMKNGFKYLYIHPMSSLNEFVVSTQVLKNETGVNQTNQKDVIKILGSKKSTFQASASAYDEKTGNLFYALVNKDGVGCWNSRRNSNRFDPTTTGIVIQNSTTMIYVVDVKVDNNDNLWAMSNRFPYFTGNNVSSNEINLRIFAAPIKQILQKTVCY